MKTNVVMAALISGLLATSLSYAEPADDMLATNDAPDASSSQQAAPMTMLADNVGASDSSSSGSNSNMTNSSGSNDSSADTATGDDDY